MSALAELVSALHVGEGIVPPSHSTFPSPRVRRSARAARTRAHHEQLGAHDRPAPGILGRGASDRDERPAVAYGGEQRAVVSPPTVSSATSAPHRPRLPPAACSRRLVGAEAQHEIAVTGGADADHPCARQLGELHGEMADASGGARHDSRLPSPSPPRSREPARRSARRPVSPPPVRGSRPRTSVRSPRGRGRVLRIPAARRHAQTSSPSAKPSAREASTVPDTSMPSTAGSGTHEAPAIFPVDWVDRRGADLISTSPSPGSGRSASS